MRADGPGSFLHHDEGLCPESYYSNTMGALLHMMRAYALIGTTCILRLLSLHLSSVVSSLMHCRRRPVVNELIRD